MLFIFPPTEIVCVDPVRISFFGDVYVDSKGLQRGESLFKNVQPLLEWGHFNVANFEGVVTESAEKEFPDLPFALKSEKNLPSILSKYNIKYVTRANNHAMDYGYLGMTDTSTALRNQNIRWAGVGENSQKANEPFFLNRNGLRIAVLSSTTTIPMEAWASRNSPGVSQPASEAFLKSLRAARLVADAVIVVFHWGEELSAKIKPHQEKFAQLAVNEGADLVIGHHAHVAQAISEFKQKPIVYGLGNFVFTGKGTYPFSISTHIEVCPGQEKSGVNLRIAHTPLRTYSKENGYATEPYSTLDFIKMARKYFDQNYFPHNAMFYIYEKNRSLPFKTWMQDPQFSELSAAQPRRVAN